MQANKARELERMKHESALIIKILEVDDLDNVTKNFDFLIRTGLVLDETRKRILFLEIRGVVSFFHKVMRSLIFRPLKFRKTFLCSWRT